MSAIDTIYADVLVLGAGLAGLRAAWAVREIAPHLEVCVVSQQEGPSGSSFANVNDMLGMQVCLDDGEKSVFLEEVSAIAPPGEIDPGLVAVMAEESLPRLMDLESAGLHFRKEGDGQWFRTTGCFSLKQRAVIFSGLHDAFRALRTKAAVTEKRFLSGWSVCDLIREAGSVNGRIIGALLFKKGGCRYLAVRAGAVVVALGGPASLFLLNVAGPGTPGYSYALLQRHGARLVNRRFLQFMWHRLPRGGFWPVQDLAASGWMLGPDEAPFGLPERFRPLMASRAQHCPASYGRADSEIDRYLASYLDLSGSLGIFSPAEGWFPVGLMAHAGNGGARIDVDGWTGVPGLYACGESASGMHGANRIGGAMVLATQVFGRRSGQAAAKFARDAAPVPKDRFEAALKKVIAGTRRSDREFAQILPKIRSGLQRYGLLGGYVDGWPFLRAIREWLSGVSDWRLRLALESARILITGDEERMCDDGPE